MKTTKFFAAAALTALVALTSCNKGENETPVNTEDFKVTLKFKAPESKALGDAAKADAITLENGHIIFTNSIGTITHVVSSATAIGNQTLSDVPGASAKVYIVANTGLTAPVKGTSISTYLATSVDVIDQDNYTQVAVTGVGNITGTAPSMTATVALSTNVTRIEIVGIKLADGVAAKLEGIFINGYYTDFKLDGTNGTAKAESTIAADFVGNSTLYPSALEEFIYDLPAKTGTAGAAISAGNKKVWGYNLFTKAGYAPQIVLKFSDFTYSSTNHGTQFVTIQGFEGVNELASNTVYRIGAFDANGDFDPTKPGVEVTPLNPSVDPGVTPINVAVTVTPVTWEIKDVIPVI